MLIAAPFPVKGHSTARACTSLFCAAKEQKCAILWLEGQQHSLDVTWMVSFVTVCRRGRFRERGSDGWRNPTLVWGLKWFGRQQLLDPLPSQESDKLLIQLLHVHFYNTERISFLRTNARFIMFYWTMVSFKNHVWLKWISYLHRLEPHSWCSCISCL